MLDCDDMLCSVLNYMTKKEKDLIAENKMLTAQVTALRELLRMLLSACGYLLVASGSVSTELRQQIRAALGENNKEGK